MQLIWVLVLSFICVYFIFTLLRLEVRQNHISSGTPIESGKQGGKALFVIDMQNDLTHPHGAISIKPYEMDAFIQKQNAFIKTVENEWVVVYIQMIYRKHWLFRILTRFALKDGSYGAELDERLYQAKKAYYFKKYIRDAFSNSELDQTLTTLNITDIYCIGVDAKYCINNTLIASKKRNYNTFVIKDLVETTNRDALPKLYSYWEKQGIGLI